MNVDVQLPNLFEIKSKVIEIVNRNQRIQIVFWRLFFCRELQNKKCHCLQKWLLCCHNLLIDEQFFNEFSSILCSLGCGSRSFQHRAKAYSVDVCWLLTVAYVCLLYFNTIHHHLLRQCEELLVLYRFSLTSYSKFNSRQHESLLIFNVSTLQVNLPWIIVLFLCIYW